MNSTIKITTEEFTLLQEYIEKQCGISLPIEKGYLIENRLSPLLKEYSCNSFFALYKKLLENNSASIRSHVVDAMTTNETLWFRDSSPFITLEKHILPIYHKKIQQGKLKKIKIWSAASSTGQEAYSIAMTIHEYARLIPGFHPSLVEIVATDISPTVLESARSGVYDAIAMSRGISEDYKSRYFKTDGKQWKIIDEIRSMVSFRHLNLLESFANIGSQDIVFCRNVLIYFTESSKRDILSRISKLISPEGFLFLGASESLTSYSSDFGIHKSTRGLCYIKKNTL